MLANFLVWAQCDDHGHLKGRPCIDNLNDEDHMTHPAKPALTKDGVAFTVVTAEFITRDCLITKEALVKLTNMPTENIDPLEIFHAFEAKINGVARRLVNANVPGDPLQLGPHSFH
jgi:hypothetical protein